MNSQPSTALYVNAVYFHKLAEMKGFSVETAGAIPVITRGFDSYQKLVGINSVFSNHPRGFPSDRTGTIKTPIKYHVPRSWTCPEHSITLDQAMQIRVKEIESKGQRINVMWSGGIDSTAVVNAFLLNLKDLKQLRVIYSPYSEYEHRHYLQYLKDRGIETVDMSGTVYLDTYFDGIFVTGFGGDESHASLDESFLLEYGYEALHRPWRDFFWAKRQDNDFMDFCEMYFSLAGRKINTVLEARWWFYINSKMHALLQIQNIFWSDYPNYNKDLVLAFFDCDAYEQYVTYNLNDIVLSKDYSSWKHSLKDYCFRADGFEEWYRTKSKVGSSQITYYANKKVAIKDLHCIFILENGQRITTPSLPLFSKLEYNKYHGTTLDYLWNEPD
jgi:hypothetical protein